MMFLQSGERIDLDDEPQALRRGIAELIGLPRNQVRRAELPPVVRRVPRNTSQSLLEGRRRLQGSNPIEEYNHQTDLLDLLTRAGGRVAHPLGDGGVLMHCPCPNHQHHDARASLEIRPAKNSRRCGRFVAYGYAPGAASVHRG